MKLHIAFLDISTAQRPSKVRICFCEAEVIAPTGVLPHHAQARGAAPLRGGIAFCRLKLQEPGQWQRGLEGKTPHAALGQLVTAALDDGAVQPSQCGRKSNPGTQFRCCIQQPHWPLDICATLEPAARDIELRARTHEAAGCQRCVAEHVAAKPQPPMIVPEQRAIFLTLPKTEL